MVGAATVLHRRGGRVGVAASVGVAGGVPERQRATPGQALLHSGDAGLCCWVAARSPLQEQARGRPGFCFDLRASRGAGGKHGRTHTRLPRAPVPVLARFLSGVRAWEAFVGSVLPNGGADYGARRGRGRRRCQSWSRSASSSAPKPASGPSMRNIWMVRSGSTWTWLRNASTLRPVSSSIIWL